MEDSPYSSDPLVNVGWDKTTRYPTDDYNILPSQQNLVHFIDVLRTVKNHVMVVPFHTANLFLQQDWRTFEDKLKKRDPVAIAYQQQGEPMLVSRGPQGKAMFLNTQEDERWLRSMSAANIIESYRLPAVQMAGNTLTQHMPSGSLTSALIDQSRAVVNYWGDLEQLDYVGFILRKQKNGPYVFEPYSGIDYPAPLDMLYEDCAGNLRNGVYINIGRVTYTKFNEPERKVDETTRMLVSGLPARVGEPVPSLDRIKQRLNNHPRVTLNVKTEIARYQ